MTNSSVTFAEPATENPRAHGCRPQQSFLRRLYSSISFRDLFPFKPLHQVARRWLRRARDQPMLVIGTDVTLEDLDLQVRTDRSHDDLAEVGG